MALSEQERAELRAMVDAAPPPSQAAVDGLRSVLTQARRADEASEDVA